MLRRLPTLVLLAVAACATSLPAADGPLRDVVDRRIEAAWKRESVTPAGPASDGVFLRRAYLDLTGTIPTWQEAQAFLDDEDPAKREKLIDRLLDDPRYGRHQADVWDMVLFGRSPAHPDARDRDGFRDWMQQQFAENVPYDVWVEKLLKADGNTVEHGAPMFLIQYARKPEDAAVAVTRTFLGVQLQCARCHDHPYEDYSQVDFYGMAAFFARLQRVQVGKQDKLKKLVLGEKNLGEVLFTGPAADQEPGQKGKPIPARFMKGDVVEEPELPEDFEEPRNFPNGKVPPEPKFSRKDALAEWITDPENPWFARAIANRLWGQYMGRGIVHPVDNLSEANPASHPELLDALAEGLIEHDFDLKWFVRELCNSRTYQLSHMGETEEARPVWFERARVRPLSAEELADAWRVATWYEAAADEKDLERLKGSRFHPLTSGYVLRFFGRPTDGTGNFTGGLHEHLYFNNGQVSSLITTREGGLYHALKNSEEAWRQRVEKLFLSVLSRRPTSAESEQFVAYLDTEEEQDERIREAIWTLMTCSEFRFNH